MIQKRTSVFIFVTALILSSTTMAQKSPLNKEQKELMVAAETGDAKKFRKLTADEKIDLNIQDEEGMTLLMSAALTGQDVIAKELIKTKKADLELKNRVGDTALAVALGNEQYEVAKLLVNAGSNQDIKIYGNEGVTPFMIAADNDLELAKLMLKKDKSALEKQDMNGNTPLLRAVMDENLAAVQYLISAGAKKDHANKAGLTASVIANKSDNKKLKSVLIKAK